MAAERIEGFPLSAQQRRLWRLSGGEPARLVARCVVEIAGPPDECRLRAAVAAVVAKHEILRTAFVRLGGGAEPVQVQTSLPPCWEHSEAEEARVDEELSRLGEGIDLAAGPLFRCALLRLAPERHRLLIALPALAADERSLALLAGAIARAYGGAADPEPLAYVDYVAWQRELVEEDEAERGRSWWRRLAPLPEAALPFARRKAPDDAFLPSRLSVPLPHTLGDALAAMTRSHRAPHAASAAAAPHDASAANAVLAAWAVLLWRLTGSESVVVGVGVDGRSVDDLTGAIGLFDRVLPIRIAPAEWQSFASLAAQVGEELRQGQVAQDHFTWELFGGGANGIAFAFDWQTAPEPVAAGRVSFKKIQVGGQPACSQVEASSIPTRAGLAGEPFSIRLAGGETPAGLRLALEYDAAAVEEPGWLVPPLLALLESALSDPDAPLAALALMAPDDRRRALADATPAEPPAVATAHALVAAQVARTPEAIALVAGEESLTYRELAERAHRLAHWLRAQGIGAETRIAVCMERGFDLMAALLGILESGAAFVPLDPSHPAERLAFLLADSRAPLLLTGEAVRPRLPETAARIVSLPFLDEALREQPAYPPLVDVEPQNLAYVMYTSGSTGRPKGVEVPHLALANYLAFCAGAYFSERVKDCGPSSENARHGGRALHSTRLGGVPVHSSLGFDLTLTSLLAPLVAGDHAILLRDDRSFEALVEELRANDSVPGADARRDAPLSLVKLTPSHLRLLPGAALARGVAVAVVGGEALSGEDLHVFAERLPDVRVVNEYGPTEATVGCCVHEVLAREAAPGPVPIGRPIVNARLHLLDARCEPVPVGVPGEIYIAGLCLARGYLGRPDLTAERFLPDLAGVEPGARMYRTGDLARRRPDGALEYLGRADQQVKVRGYRVELAEVEAALAEQPAVARAAVVARDGGEEGKRLVAYYVPRAEPRATVSDLAATLRARLPDFMVPAAFVELAELPLNANGKVDVAALPAPEAVRPKLAQAFVAPRTALESALAALWRDCLRLDAVGVDDSFFDLGGNSWLVLRVHARLEELARRPVPVVDLFAYPTIAALAAHLESATAKPEIDLAAAAAAGARRRQAAERRSVRR